MIQELHGSGGGGKGGGGSASTPVEAPNTLQSASTARLIDLIGEGPIVGLVEGLKSVYLDDTPLQNTDGSYNFKGVTVETRTGEAIQTSIPGFPSVETEIDVSTQVKKGTPIVRTVSNLQANAVRVKIRVPALTAQSVVSGDIKGSSVTLTIETQPSGGSWSTPVSVVITGKTTSPYERQTRIQLTGSGPWNVRVTRITADSTKAVVQNDTFWSSYTEVIDSKLTYPDSALVGLTVDAKLFGSGIPTRAYDVKGRIIRVPTNYDPETRIYTGIWDGSFKLAWTDNPAWCYYDLATHPRYGAGIDNVDKLSLYQIGQYCDELVPDGYGGMEPRFTLNTVLADREEAINALNFIASVFRGMSFWGNNTVVPVADMPSDPVRLVTPANVADGEMDLSGSSLKDRHSAVAVTWNDPDNNYTKQVELVEDQDAIVQFGWRQADITAVGCTSRGQAHRLGKWLLYSEQNETSTLTYTAGTDHSDIRPGDIIQVSNPDWAGARLHGRLVATGDTTLTLDKLPDVVSGSDWFLDIMLPTGRIERKEIITFSQETNQVTLASALSATPVQAAVFVLSSVSITPFQFRVTGLTESGPNLYDVTAVQHNPAKYDFVESNIALPEKPTSLIPTGPLPSPLNITVDEYLYKAGVGVVSGATISVTAPADPRISLYEFEVQRPDDAGYSLLTTQPQVIADLPNTMSGEYKIRVRTVSTTGLRSAFREGNFSLQGLLLPPADITDFRATVNNGQINLWWTPVLDLDLDHYEVRYTPDIVGASWVSSQVLIESVPAGLNSISVTARKGSYLIRAVDTSGIYSVNATVLTSEIAELDSYNVVEVVDDTGTWGGMNDGTVKSGSQLQLDSSSVVADWTSLSEVVTMTFGVSGFSSEGWYYASSIVDMGEVYTARLTSEVSVFGLDILGTIRSWVTLSSVDRMGNTDSDQWNLTLEISQSSTTYPATPADWTAWEPFTIGEHTARAFRFRLHLVSYSPAVTPSVSKMKITVDMPDRVAGMNDLTCPVGGIRINYDPAFISRPALSVDAQALSVGDRKEVTLADNTGFTVEFFDSGGTSVSRTFDYLAKGYGRRV